MKMVSQLLKAWGIGTLLAGTIVVCEVYVFRSSGVYVSDLSSIHHFLAKSEIGLLFLTFTSVFFPSLALLAVAAAIAIPMDKFVIRTHYVTLLFTPVFYAIIVSAFHATLSFKRFNRPDLFIEFFGQNSMSTDIWVFAIPVTTGAAYYCMMRSRQIEQSPSR
jgi:hypothetical protein